MIDDDDEDDPLDVPVNARVHVFDMKGNDLGLGTCVGVETLRFAVNDDEWKDFIATVLREGGDEAMAQEFLEEGIDSPKFKLDTGEIIFAYFCQWVFEEELDDIAFAH